MNELEALGENLKKIRKSKGLEALGENLKKIRKSKGLSQQDLSNILQIRQATISDIEKGKINFEINTLIKICNALQLDINIEFSNK